MGRSRYWFGEVGFPHFLTSTVVGWLPVFTRPETVQIGRKSAENDRDGGDAATEAGVHSRQPGEAGLCERSDTLAGLERQELCEDRFVNTITTDW